MRQESIRRRASLGELVREALQEKYGSREARRHEAVERLFSVDAPVADWEQMKREIEEGRLR